MGAGSAGRCRTLWSFQTRANPRAARPYRLQHTRRHCHSSAIVHAPVTHGPAVARSVPTWELSTPTPASRPSARSTAPTAAGARESHDRAVDPFIGTDVTDLPPPSGLAATWWWPKPQIGNTHPGRDAPARHGLGVRLLGRLPHRLRPVRHEHRGRAADDPRRGRGVGIHALPAVGHRRDPQVLQLLPRHADARAARRARHALGPRRTRRPSPATTPPRSTRASAASSPSGRSPRCTATRSPRHHDARLVVDFSLGGLAIAARRDGADAGRTSTSSRPASPRARSSSRARRSPCTSSATPPRWRQMLWYDRRLMAGGSRLDVRRASAPRRCGRSA